MLPNEIFPSVIYPNLYNFRKVSEVSLKPRTLTSDVKLKQLAALTDKKQKCSRNEIKKRLYQ